MKARILFWLAVCFGIHLAPVAHAQDEGALAALVQVLTESDDPQLQLDILRGMHEGLQGRREVRMPSGWEEAAARLSKSSKLEVRELTQSLSLVFGSSAALGALRGQLKDRNADVEARKSALQSLAQAKDPELPATSHALLRDPALRGAALRALAGYDDPETPAAILGIYDSLGVAEKKDALNTLVSRAAYARRLLGALANREIPSRDLTADIVRQFRHFNDPEINSQVEKLWGVTRETEADKLNQIARLKAMLQTSDSADPHYGRALFAKVCQQCHALFGTGGSVGPDITGSNRGDLDYILQNVVDPNAVIPNDYSTSILETKDDRILTGIVTREDANAVTVATANDTVIVPRDEIASLRKGEVSMMPEGLLDALQEKEIRDLIAYLRSPAQVPMRATEDNVSAFFNGNDIEGWEGNTNLWRVENGEVVGVTEGLKRNEFLKGTLLFSDFRLICKVKLAPNEANSGIQFRSKVLPDGTVRGYQADIGAGWWGKLYEEHGRGLLWEKSCGAHVNAGEWNTYEILAVGSRIRTAINGHMCVDLDDSSGSREGIIAFQLHSGGPMEVRFKDFELELNPEFRLKTKTL